MDKVYASVEGGFAQYLSSEKQMDEMLEKGANLYVYHEDTHLTELLATPEQGYLLPKPVITVKLNIGGVTNG